MTTHYRRVIRITCEHSPNVQLARREITAGREPTNRTVVPGVLGWEALLHHRRTWDKVRQCVGLDGEFYVGAQLLLYPPEWLNLSHDRWRALRAVHRVPKALGIDPAEGGDKTSVAVIDELGLIELYSQQTADTAVIAPFVRHLIDRHAVPCVRVCFDRGGGGKQIADQLRTEGYAVRTVGFGETLALDPKHGKTRVSTRKDVKEAMYHYLNRRAQMYWELSQAIEPSQANLDASGTYIGFALPPLEEGPVYGELRKQLAVMDKLYDKEGRARMRPKNRVGRGPVSADVERTLTELIGHSPDEADALVLALHALLHRGPVSQAGVA